MTAEDDNDDITRKAIQAAEHLYSDPRIRRFDPASEQKIAGKNHMFHGDLDFGQVEFLVSFPGSRGDWSLSKTGLLYLSRVVEESKIIRGIVTLRRGAFQVKGGSITRIWPTLDKEAFWLDFGSGEFTWVDADFNLATNSGSGSRYYHPDDPTPL